MIIHNPVITGSLQVNGSSVSSIEQLDSVSGSVAALNNATSSYALKNSISGSFTSLSSSLSTRLTDDEGSLTSLNAATSSYLQNTTDTLTGDLTVTGTITAQDLHVQEVTSSIVYSSGSNIFGSLTSDSQQVTGSLLVNGTGAGSVGTVNIKGSNAHLGFTSGSGTFRSWVGHFDSLGHGSEADLNIKTGYGTTGNIRFSADGDTTAAQMYLQGSSGRVGIGTTSPSYKTQIEGTGDHRLYLFNPGLTSSDKAVLQAEVSGSSSGNAYAFFGRTGAGWSSGVNVSSNKFIIRSNWDVTEDASARLVIDSSGNMGFNTSVTTVGGSGTQTSTATPKRILFNNDYSNGYTDGSLKLYLFNLGATRHGFTSGPNFDLQYHSSGHSTQAAHTFYTNNNFVMRIGTGDTTNVGIGTTNPSDKLVIDSAATGKYGLTISDFTGGGSERIKLQYEGSTGIGYITSTYNPGGADTATLKIQTGGSNDRIVVTRDGNVGIGTTSPGAKLHVNGRIKVTEGDVMQLGSMAEQYPYRRLDSFEHDGSGYFWGFGTKYGSTQKINAFFVGQARTFHAVDSLQVVTWTANEYNTSYPTYSVKASIDSDGMKFNGDTAAANALNDYEEGSWTPRLQGTTSGQKTATAINIGRYTKIGNLVTVTGTCAWNGGDTLSGLIIIANLPFTVGSPTTGTQQYRPGACAGGTAGITMPTGYTNGLAFGADQGTTYIYIMARSTSSYTHNPTIDSSGAIYGFTMTYETTA